MAFTAIDVERTGPVATIKIKPFETTQAEGSKHKDFIDVHAAIGIALENFRWDDTVPIVVVTASPDGEPHGYPFGMTPGDGAGALVPLFMPPTKAKEYLFLSPGYTAKELAAMNIVNYALPLDKLDEKTNELIERLLKRPARTLARTKRGVHKMLI